MSEVSLGAPLAEFLTEAIPATAAKAHKRCRHIPADDFEQAMWLEMLARADRYKRYFTEGRGGLIQKELYRACSKLRREDDRYRKALKAARDGFSVYDYEFYSTGVLGLILTVLVEADFDVSVAMETASAGTDAAGVHIGSSDPFGGKENYLVVLTDVAKAYDKLPEGSKRLLATYYGVTQDDTDEGRWERQRLAGSMGLTADTLRQRAHRALQRLQDELGGCDPWQSLTPTSSPSTEAVSPPAIATSSAARSHASTSRRTTTRTSLDRLPSGPRGRRGQAKGDVPRHDLGSVRPHGDVRLRGQRQDSRVADRDHGNLRVRGDVMGKQISDLLAAPHKDMRRLQRETRRARRIRRNRAIRHPLRALREAIIPW